jgi:hypothetical protein
MSVTYANSLKDTRMTAVITAIDAGAGAGTLEICTAAYASVLCIITLNDPSFALGAQAITMNGVPKSGTAGAGGTAALARIKESGGTVVIQGLTVGTTGSDINLNSTAISSGQTVTITSGTISHG